MAMLARVRAGDRAHVSRPAPSGLEDEAAHVDLVERDDLDEAVRKASDLVGPAEAFALQSWHDAGVSRWCSWIPEVVRASGTRIEIVAHDSVAPERQSAGVTRGRPRRIPRTSGEHRLLVGGVKPVDGDLGQARRPTLEVGFASPRLHS